MTYDILKCLLMHGDIPMRTSCSTLASWPSLECNVRSGRHGCGSKKTWFESFFSSSLQWVEIKYRCECKNRHNIDKKCEWDREPRPTAYPQPNGRRANKAKIHTTLANTNFFFFPFASSFLCLFNSLVLLLLLFVAASFVLQCFFFRLSRSRSLYRRESVYTEKKIVCTNCMCENCLWPIRMVERVNERKPFCDGCMGMSCVWEAQYMR